MENKRAILYALIGILTATNLITIFYYSRSDNSKLEYNLINPARKSIGQENLIVNFQPLREDLQNTYEKKLDISIYFEYLPTGANISINKDAEFWPASLLKVPVAMAVAKKVEKGEWKWTNELVLLNTDKDELFGDLYKNPIGTRFTIEKLLEEMLARSDNTAKRIFVRNIEPEDLKNIYEHLGLSKLFSEEGKIGAKRYSILLRSLYNSSYLSDQNSEKILSILTRTAFNDFLALAFPPDIKFAHKIGIEREEKVFLDSGIVYIPGRPYILTAMIANTDELSAKNKMKDISEKVYNYVTAYSEKD